MTNALDLSSRSFEGDRGHRTVPMPALIIKKHLLRSALLSLGSVLAWIFEVPFLRINFRDFAKKGRCENKKKVSEVPSSDVGHLWRRRVSSSPGNFDLHGKKYDLVE